MNCSSSQAPAPITLSPSGDSGQASSPLARWRPLQNLPTIPTPCPFHPHPSPLPSRERGFLGAVSRLWKGLHGSSRCAQMATTQWRRSETTGSYSLASSTLYHMQGPTALPQTAPVSDPLRFRPRVLCHCHPTLLIALPTSIQKRSPYQHAPVRAAGSSSRYMARPGDLPDHDQVRRRLVRALNAVPYPCMHVPALVPALAPGRVPASGQNTVDRLSRIWMPSQRAYLLPRLGSGRGRTSPAPDGLRDRRRQQLQQTHNRGYPSSGPVGVQNVPGNWRSRRPRL